MSNAKTNKEILQNLWILVLVVLIATAFATYYAIKWPRTDAAPTPSYQEKNLEVLKATQPNDLVICVGEKPGGSHIKFAFLVEQNMGTYMTGHYPSQRTLSRADGGESFVLLSTWECEMQILRPSETRVASDMLASIILYGFKYAPPK